MTSKQHQLQGFVQLIVDHYYDIVKLTEANWNRDNYMATRIQAKYRMYRLNKYYRRNREAAICIQKEIRAFLARQIYKRKKIEKSNQQNNIQLRFFTQQAIVIQRYYKGYNKRKYYHDFYARRQYLNFLSEKNKLFKTELDQVQEYESAREQEEEKVREEQCAKEEFVRLAQNLHHLSSTATQPGIYKPPFAKEAPKAFDLEVETQIKATKPPKARKISSARISNSNERFRVRPSTQNTNRR